MCHYKIHIRLGCLFRSINDFSSFWKSGRNMKGHLVFGRRKPELQYRLRRGIYALVCDDKNRVLTIRKPWGVFLPGGGLEEGETHEECLHRELLEETGFSIEIEKKIGHAKRYFVRHNTGEPMLSDAHFYAVHLTGQTREPMEENHETLWLGEGRLRLSLFHEHHIWAAMEFLKLIRD